MQYILTEEEFQNLKESKSLADKNQVVLPLSKSQLQKLCTNICNTMPVVWVGWAKDRPLAPWGCILNGKNYEIGGSEWYCDSCPVAKICPHEWKSYSK